jgi:hypothetical protein
MPGGSSEYGLLAVRPSELQPGDLVPYVPVTEDEQEMREVQGHDGRQPYARFSPSGWRS